MHLLYEILPVFLFFIAFKWYGIYVATVVGIVTTFIQVVLTRVWKKQWDRKQLITLGVFSLFGGMTLYFHDPIFVKWKPTIVFWIFALAIVGSQLFTQKPLIQRLMESMVQDKASVPTIVWKKLNLFWAIFFATLGGINLYVAYQLSNDAWVNFKFYGITSALLVFSFVQAAYLMRYVSEPIK
jgi:intracellular septation protein